MKAPGKPRDGKPTGEGPGLPLRHALLGVLQLARGRKDGLRQFENTPQAVLAGLAPLAAFMLVGAVLSLLGGSRGGVTDVAGLTVLLLGPLVFSFDLARRWGCEVEWPRFAAAFCWCHWTAPLALMAVTLLTATLMAGGLDENSAAELGLGLLCGYGLWLHWFLARHALGLSGWRAAGLVAAVNLLTMALFLLPQWADYALNGAPAA